MSLNNVLPADLVKGGIYRPGPETYVVITHWSVKEVMINGEKTRHICGLVNGEGRVCSPVQSFDPSKMEATTRSGKVYHLVGYPGTAADAIYVWNKWCVINGITHHENIEDVTDEYWNDE